MSSPNHFASCCPPLVSRFGVFFLATFLVTLGCTEFPRPRQSPDGSPDGPKVDSRVDGRDAAPGGDVGGNDLPTDGPCQPDEHFCSGTCFKNNDPTSCGVCGNDCAGLPNVKPGSVQCQAGKCVVPADGCVASFAHCSANPDEICETDISKPENCGACGRKCTTAAPFCSNVAGVQTCVLNCSGAAPDKCGTSCVDLKTDVNNCGMCGKICSFPNGEASCVNGACVMSRCKTGYGDCTAEPGCETQLVSTANCGACGKSCLVTNGSAICTGGTCGPITCNAGWGNCDTNPDCETQLNTPTNCGKCGTACDTAKPLCSTVGGQQTCVSDCSAAAPTKCGTKCVDTKTDIANCGMCGTACSLPNAVAACTNSQCTMTSCQTGFADCNAGQPGCETPLGTASNCGRCGEVCGANLKCDAGSRTCVDICTGGGTGNAGHCCSAADCPSNLPVCSGRTCVGKPNGQSCSSSTECANGNCVDGVCCNTACGGQCEACDVNGSIGTCKAVTGAPHRNARPARAMCGGDPACGGTCNVTVTTKCTYPANQCRTASCSAARVQVNAATCDANGACPATSTTNCNFACVASTGMCGGSCIPGAKRCSGNTLQVCNSDGAYVTDTACSGNMPICDAATLTCVKRPLGNACSSPNECASGNCAFGVCCNEPCGTSCSTSCGGGTCVHKAAKTSCGKRTGVYPGNSDIFLYCDGNGSCVGPTFRCGATSNCSLTASTCCMTSPVSDSSSTVVYGCVGSVLSCQHGDGSGDTSTNTNHRWTGCVSTLDCPSGLICGAHQGTFGALGFLFQECIPAATLGNTWTNEVCDPSRPASGQCTHNNRTCTSHGDPNNPTAGTCT